MKNKIITFCLVAVCMATTQVKAQLQQGNWLVGGNIADFKLALNSGGVFNFTIDPKLAFFVKDNLALGAYVHFGLQTSKGNGADVDYGIGALGRYYVSAADVSVIRRTRLFFEGTVGINGTNPHIGETTNGLGLSIGPGLAYFLTPNVGFEGLVKYDGIVGFGSRVSTNNVILGIGLQVYLPSGLGKTSRNRQSQPLQ